MTEHRHSWAVLGFAFVDGRPTMQESCTCGAKRDVAAWDRSWRPTPAWRLVAPSHDPATAGRLLAMTSKGGAPVPEIIKVDVWSDVACPWCYIGKRNLETGIEIFTDSRDRPPVEVEYHSFELAPDTPIDFDGSELDYLTGVKSIARDAAEQMLARIAGIAADVGLEYDFDAVKHTRTVKAHQLIHYAKAHGLQAEAKERLLRAYFVEGRHIGREAELADLAADIGLDRDDALRSLSADEYLPAVLADQQQAIAYGIRGVPFYVIGERYGLSGAQPSATFASALAQVADELLDERPAVGAQ
jgi:predicted DsbA family dithiol-disulfide isomerase